ncbi:helix-turn-helix transcriptional regulator [Leclercia sp. EC_58]|uniref:helix-turn-helix domain-containing protein n=1 Tax=Leclercia sp. EC_58 TaxID=2584090 RepID=UPI001C705879|nr:helix-turn-helix domain-containing protein [Leclercia sp. EC_58]MBW9398656.1 helix-turn-helix transcriptional regulator [Leclercia sp. EC_58]
MSELITCTDCADAGCKSAFINGGRDLSKHRYGAVTCFRCEGKGKVPAQALRWAEYGQILKSRRTRAGFTLMAGAEALKMTPAALSAIEQGYAPAPVTLREANKHGR